MPPSLNRPFQEYPIPVIRLANKASPEIPDADRDPFAEEKSRATHKNLNTDLQRLESVDNPELRRFSNNFIDKNAEARKLAKPTLTLTPSASAVKETELEKSELTNRLKLAIGIPANEEQASLKPRITELFIKAQNLIKNSEAYGGKES